MFERFFFENLDQWKVADKEFPADVDILVDYE